MGGGVRSYADYDSGTQSSDDFLPSEDDFSSEEEMSSSAQEFHTATATTHHLDYKSQEDGDYDESSDDSNSDDDEVDEHFGEDEDYVVEDDIGDDKAFQDFLDLTRKRSSESLDRVSGQSEEASFPRLAEEAEEPSLSNIDDEKCIVPTPALSQNNDGDNIKSSSKQDMNPQSISTDEMNANGGENDGMKIEQPVSPDDVGGEQCSEMPADDQEAKYEEEEFEKEVDNIINFDNESTKILVENLETSKQQKPGKSSKFVFLSDQKTVPSDLKRLQEKTRRRRREMKNQFHDLECRQGLAASKYAEEKMDLGLAIRDTYDRTVCRPLDASMERISMERETIMDKRPIIGQLEQRLARIESLMMRHTHVTMNDAKREKLDNLHQELHQEIIPRIRVEKSKSDKIEGGIVRRYEQNAGVAVRNFHEESAARRSGIDIVQEKIQNTIDNEERRSYSALDVIADLRQQIHREREERRAADKKIMEEIVKTSLAMQRAFLAAFDDSSKVLE